MKRPALLALHLGALAAFLATGCAIPEKKPDPILVDEIVREAPRPVPRGLGVSYEEALRGIGPRVAMKPAPPDGGLPVHTGRVKGSLGVVTLVGETTALERAGFTVPAMDGVPISAADVKVLRRLVANVAPGLKKGEAWVDGAIRDCTAGIPVSQRVGRAQLRMERLQGAGLLRFQAVASGG